MKKKILFCIVCAMASMAMACDGVDAVDGEIKMAVKSGRMIKSCTVMNGNNTTIYEYTYNEYGDVIQVDKSGGITQSYIFSYSDNNILESVTMGRWVYGMDWNSDGLLNSVAVVFSDEMPYYMTSIYKGRKVVSILHGEYRKYEYEWTGDRVSSMTLSSSYGVSDGSFVKSADAAFEYTDIVSNFNVPVLSLMSDPALTAEFFSVGEKGKVMPYLPSRILFSNITEPSSEYVTYSFLRPFEFVYEFNDLGDVCRITDIHTNAVCTIEYY